MLSIVDRFMGRLLGSDNQVPPLRQVSTTVPCKVVVHPEVNLERWIEVAKGSGTYQKVHIGNPGMPRPPWHPDHIPVAGLSMPDRDVVLLSVVCAVSVVRAVSFNQEVNMDEVKTFAREHGIGTASAFEHIALDMQYAQVTNGLTLISSDTEHCSVCLMSCGPIGNRELFVGPFIPSLLRRANTRWLVR